MTETDTEVEEATMRQALAVGEARPLSPATPDLVRWRDGWWTSYAFGWLRILDPHLTADLNTLARCLARAQTTTTKPPGELRADEPAASTPVQRCSVTNGPGHIGGT